MKIAIMGSGGVGGYDKAEDRGFSRKAVDQELRSIRGRLSPEDRKRFSEALRTKDNRRFAWEK